MPDSKDRLFVNGAMRYRLDFYWNTRHKRGNIQKLTKKDQEHTKLKSNPNSQGEHAIIEHYPQKSSVTLIRHDACVLATGMHALNQGETTSEICSHADSRRTIFPTNAQHSRAVVPQSIQQRDNGDPTGIHFINEENIR